MRPVVLLLIVGALGGGGCDNAAGRSGRAQSGHPPESELTGRADTIQAASSGVELEAPRLIPGLRAQLTALGDSAGMTEGNVTAYRNLAADVVNAMEADLSRLGSPAVDRISELGDSVVSLIGGGAGEAPEPPPDRVQASIGLMQRLIEEYQAASRAIPR
jgi:hypothetical protein